MSCTVIETLWVKRNDSINIKNQKLFQRSIIVLIHRIKANDSLSKPCSSEVNIPL